MITSALFMLLTAFFLMVATILGSVMIVVPDQILVAITWAFNSLYVFEGVFPIGTLLECVGIILTFEIALQMIKLFFRFVVPFIPILGRRISMPGSVGFRKR